MERPKKMCAGTRQRAHWRAPGVTSEHLELVAVLEETARACGDTGFQWRYCVKLGPIECDVVGFPVHACHKDPRLRVAPVVIHFSAPTDVTEV